MHSHVALAQGRAQLLCRRSYSACAAEASAPGLGGSGHGCGDPSPPLNIARVSQLRATHLLLSAEI